MSLTVTLSAALTGLGAAKRNLDLIANNIANVNTEGFSRKQLAQETLVLAGEGRGVRAEDIARSVDAYLNRELRTQKGERARDQWLVRYLERIQSELFGAPGEPERGLSKKLANLGQALQTFAADPSKLAAREELVGTLDDLLTDLTRAGARVQELRQEADRRIAALVEDVNRIIRSLDELNAEFLVGRGTAELEDARDRLLAELAELVEISVVPQDKGTIAVYARGGVPLLEYSPRVLIYDPVPVVAPDTVFDAIEVYDRSQIDPDTGRPRPGEKGMELVSGGAQPDTPLTSGELVGLLRVRDRRLPELQGQIDEFAELLRFALNRAHNAASPVPPPAALTGTRTDAAADFDAAVRSGTAYVGIVDLTSGEVVELIAVDLDTLADASALAAALDAALSAPPYGGGASWSADGRLQLQVGPGYGIALNEGTSAVRWTDSEGRERTYGLAHFFGLNDLVVIDSEGELAVRSEIRTQLTGLSAALLEVDASGSAATLGGIVDNRGAQRLLTALEDTVPTQARGGIPAREVGAVDYLADLIAFQAGELDRLRDALAADEALLAELERQRSAVSGVNLDEELARLVVYQQAYAASARVIRTTEELFDELMRMVG